MNHKEPIGQHFVPKCYLKNFYTKVVRKKKKSEYFVDLLDKSIEIKECQQYVNIKNICKINEFYTFSKLLGESKKNLERLFSDTVEKDYGLIYPLLIDKEQVKLSGRQRIELIYFVISLYFRNAKSTNQFTVISEDIIRRSLNFLNPDKGITKIRAISNNVYDLSKETIEDVITKEKNFAKENANIVKFKIGAELSHQRCNDIISITKVHPKHYLITSDNPVFFVGDPLNPDTLIKMPLNHEYYLTILPRKVYSEFNPIEVLVGSFDEDFSFLETTNNNLNQIQNSERFLIGKKENILRSLSLSDSEEVKKLIHDSFAVEQLFKK